MRRLSAALLALACLGVLSLPTAAAGATYTLPELSLQVTLPDGYYAFTREIDPSDPHLALFDNIHAEEALETYYKDSGIYLDMYAEDGSCEIFVSMAQDRDTRRNFDFNRYTDEVVLGFGQEIQNGVFDGITYTSCELFPHAQAKFLQLDFELRDGDTVQYGQQVFTIINGQEIGFSLYSSSGPVTEEMALALRQIVETARFTEVLAEPPASAVPWIVAAAVAVAAAAVLLVLLLRRRRRSR